MTKIAIIPERHLADARSKRKICLFYTNDLEYIREQIKDHDIHDRFDGLCVFESEMLSALRGHGIFSDEYRLINDMFQFYRSYFNDEALAHEMASLGLVTSIDRVIHGKRLIKHFLHE